MRHNSNSNIRLKPGRTFKLPERVRRARTQPRYIKLRVKCGVCGKEFPSKKSLKAHKYNEHSF